MTITQIAQQQTSCMTCSPLQVVSVAEPITDITAISISDQNGNIYCDEDFQYSYSLDGGCWSCFACKDKTIQLTDGLDTDFFVRIKMRGAIGQVNLCDKPTQYSCSLASGFDFTLNCSNTTNMYSPYANLDYAIAYQQYLSNVVSCIVGIPIKYFKVSGVEGSKDITFKEYALKEVVNVKQLKLIVADGQMPSSKPEFNDFGIDFATDWETEINKQEFATAFGETAQPTEGDFIWIPLMKRMWQVNSAYEEKKDGLMWQNTTFKLALVKYQDKASIDLNDQEDFVNSLISSTYENMFGDNENLDSGEQSVMTDNYQPNALYNVYESDATRKFATVDKLSFRARPINQKSAKVADNVYVFGTIPSYITYQKQFCGDEGSMSFIFTPQYIGTFENIFIKINGIHIKCSFDKKVKLTLMNNQDMTLLLQNGKTYFVYLRWSKKMNNIEFTACENKCPTNIPIYQVQPFHNYFDVDNPTDSCLSRYDIEMTQDTKGDVSIHNIPCEFTNFKLFDVYNSNIGELMQQYPTSQHLLINDTARQFLTNNGVKL